MMRHITDVWNSIWSDMHTETTFMKYRHNKNGIIWIILKWEILQVCVLSLHICTQIEKDLRNPNDTNSMSIDPQHKKERKQEYMLTTLTRKVFIRKSYNSQLIH